MYIMNPICGCILCQHALGDCTIKFESNRFRILLSAGYNHLQVLDAVEDAVSSQQSTVSSQQSAAQVEVRRHQTLPKFTEIVSPLHCCADSTGCMENRSLLTE